MKKISYKNKLIIQTIAPILGLSPLSTYAQELADSTEKETSVIETVLVLGEFSGGLEKALDLKRDADSISDSIIAADIGKLPAINIAEALQRVPGISINREGGEGQFVSVRGLGPNFQSVTFNGSPIAFNENVRNSDQTGRQFRFRVIPADLIGGLVVTKSPTADLIDGGIGSNLDLRTVKPLNKESFVSGRIFLNYDEQSDETTPNGSLAGGWQNDAGDFGVIAGVSYSERQVRFDRLQTFGYSTPDETNVPGDNLQYGQLSATVEEEERERISFLGGAQWDVTDSLELSFDVLYSEFDNEVKENRITYDFNNFDGFVPGSLATREGILNGNPANIVTAIRATDAARINRNAEFSAQAHENLFLNLKADFRSGNWTIKPSVSYSDATSGLDTPLQRIDSRTSNSIGNGVSIDYDLGSNPVGGIGIETLQTNVDLSAGGSVPFRRYRIRPINSADEDLTLLLDFQRFLDIDVAGFNLTSVKFGGQHSDRKRDYQRRDRTLVERDGVSVDGSFYTSSVSSDAFDDIINNFTNGWVGPNLDTFAQSFVGADGEFSDVRVQAGDLEATPSDLQRSYGVDEQVTALYARLDFGSTFHSVPLTGNVGFRWVDTDSQVIGTILQPGVAADGSLSTVVVPTTFDGNYREILPSLNLSFELQEDVLFRLSLSKALTRPSLADLRTALVPSSSLTSEIFELGSDALTNVNFNETRKRTGTGGNPQLDPYVSKNLDASLEWYFDEFGALTISGFYKDISDYIGSSAGVENLLFAVDPALGQGNTLEVDVTISRPENLGDANITGLELGYIDKLDNGLGLSASITFVNASLESNGIKEELQGVSDINYSISPFYENDAFEAHMSWTWRSEHNTNSNATIGSDAANGGQQPVNDDFGQLDFGMSYRFNENLTVFVDGTNLADKRQASFIVNDAFFRQAQDYGRSFNIGIKGKF